VGWLGHLDAQLEADLPNPGTTIGSMRNQRGSKAMREEPHETFPHRYGHFAPQTSTTSLDQC
jgi:hypothetical protein